MRQSRRLKTESVKPSNQPKTVLDGTGFTEDALPKDDFNLLDIPPKYRLYVANAKNRKAMLKFIEEQQKYSNILDVPPEYRMMLSDVPPRYRGIIMKFLEANPEILSIFKN